MEQQPPPPPPPQPQKGSKEDFTGSDGEIDFRCSEQDRQNKIGIVICKYDSDH